MKTFHKIFLGSLFLTALLGLSSCATDGYVGVDTGVYYGGPVYRDPWFHDGPWIDGHRGYGHPGGYIHPPRGPRGPHHR